MNPHQNWFRNICVSLKKKENLDISHYYISHSCCFVGRGREAIVARVCPVCLHTHLDTCSTDLLLSTLPPWAVTTTAKTPPESACPSTLSTTSLIVCPAPESAQASETTFLGCEFSNSR